MEIILCRAESGDSCCWLWDSRAYCGLEPTLVCVVSVELDSLEVNEVWELCDPKNNLVTTFYSHSKDQANRVSLSYTNTCTYILVKKKKANKKF